MEINKRDLKIIKKVLEWCVEGNEEIDDVDVGKTNVKDIFSVLKKLITKSKSFCGIF